MRALAITLFIPMALMCGCADTSPWPSVSYTTIRAYAWPHAATDEIPAEEVVLSGMRIAPNALNPQGTPLASEQVQKLMAAVSGKHSEHPIAGCHVPHNALVFYDGTKPVAFVEICFECLSCRTSPRGADRYPDLPALAEIFTELKLPLGKYTDATAFNVHYKKVSGTK